MATPGYLVCPSCDLVLQNVTTPTDHVLVCPRCAFKLHRYKHNALQKTLALSLTGLLLYLPAITLPLLTLDILGTNSSTSIFLSTLSMFNQGQYFPGLIVILTGVVFPLLTLSFLFLVSLGLTLNWQYSWMPFLLRKYQHLTEWAMTDVYLVAVLITIIKMSHMAKMDFNTGFFCFIGLVTTTIAAQTAIDHKLFWSLLETKHPTHPETRPSTPEQSWPDLPADYILCHSCHKILPPEDSCKPIKKACPRCGEKKHRRKNNSINHTWALVITALLLTFPANLLPIMEVEYFGIPEQSTIMDGIIYFFKDGSYGIGIVILTASILVPLFKIIGLLLILLSIHFQWQGWLKHKSIMFRFIEFIGRWSMLDIFVIALLCALVKFGFLSTINTAPAALYFTGVVLSTMFAAINFDPRLLWDAAQERPLKEQ